MLLFLLSLSTSVPLVSSHQEKSFISWMRETNQLFVGDEYQIRLGIWLVNQRLVKAHNAAQKSFKVEMNHLAALTPAEYKSLLGFRGSIPQRVSSVSSYKVTEDIVDWRTKNVVNPIQDQGQCGSCWAFSATQAIESAYAIAHVTLYKLSEQNFVDCVDTCEGCGGGWPDYAIKYAVNYQNGKQNLLIDYPYTAVDGYCNYNDSLAVLVTTGYISVKSGDEVDLATKVQNIGVASICIDASQWSFQLYSSGIYDEPACSQDDLDHAVGCVGFGSLNGINYWIVRNSWGVGWGEKGYIRMVKDKNNQCGEATRAVIALSA